MDAAHELEDGRRLFGRCAWLDCYTALSQVDSAAELSGPDLELLAVSAYMIGRDDEMVRGLERAHHLYMKDGEILRSVRCAFWIVITLALRGEMGPASGWLGRAQRLVQRHEDESVEAGYLLLPAVLQLAGAGEHEAALGIAAEAAEVAERFEDPDLFALAVHEQGNALVRLGRVDEGLGLLDEAMVAVVGGELSPIVTGLVYCSVIEGCHQVYALRRAREWTAALSQWCDQQPDMVAFTGQCLVHRAEIMQLRGAWHEAAEESLRACARFEQGGDPAAAAQAFYRLGELQRLRGDFSEAERAYEDASRLGREPQPGLALLRLAQGNPGAADAAMRRALSEVGEPLSRAALLPAYAEILVSTDDMADARAVSVELDSILSHYPSETLSAIAGQTRGLVELAAGDPSAALVALRHAGGVWKGLDAPYEAARARLLVGLACRALSDQDTATMELKAARKVFADLGAGPDVARVDSLQKTVEPGQTAGLSSRELEVLRLVAAGSRNREIASALTISEHTVARHLQNIFTKIGVNSRTAASAFAVAHELL